MTRKKASVFLAGLFFASFAIILLLAFLTGKNKNKNGFNRHFISGTLKIQKQKTLPFSINRLIGVENNELYFQTNSPYEILKTDYNLNSFEKIKLYISEDQKLNSSIQMFLRGKILYIAARNTPAIITYDLTSKVETKYLLKNYFNKLTNISHDHFIFRRYDIKSNNEFFVKSDLKTKDKDVQSEYKLSENDGTKGFLTDGMFYYDEHTNLACYTFFYQNGFICIDTNLNLTLKARTIDTLTTRALKVAHVGSSVTLKEPPPLINFMGCVWNGKLFLQSILQADNEYKLDFSENTIIDIYNLVDGKYEGSFYIPKYNGKSPRQFYVIENNLFAIYGKTIIKHEIKLIKSLLSD